MSAKQTIINHKNTTNPTKVNNIKLKLKTGHPGIYNNSNNKSGRQGDGERGGEGYRLPDGLLVKGLLDIVNLALDKRAVGQVRGYFLAGDGHGGGVPAAELHAYLG